MANIENENDRGIDEEYYEDNDDTEELDNEDDDPNTKFHYIITEFDHTTQSLRCNYRKKIQYNAIGHIQQHFNSTK